MEKRSGIITKCKGFIKCETHRFFGTFRGLRENKH